MLKFLPYLFTLLFAFNNATKAQINITNASTPYSEDFNTLSSTAVSSIVPAGWYFVETGSAANTTYVVDNGTGNGGNTYSFGAASSSERAFGSIQSGTCLPVIGVQFANNSGTTITSLTISYTGEQWRLGTTGRPDRLDFQYSTDATSLSTGTWLDEDNLDFTAPLSAGTIGALVGNDAANKTQVSFTIQGLNIPSGSGFWLRFNDFSATGADDGLAIDDFSINFNGNSIAPCTEPTSAPTNLVLTQTATTVSGTFTAAAPVADEYLVIRSTAVSLSASPVDGSVYTAGQAFGGGTIIFSGTSTSFTDNGLNSNTTYYYFVFASNADGCTGGPNYLGTSLNGNTVTLPLAACTTPVAAPTSLVLTPANNTILGTFNAAAGANRYLVIRSNSSILSANPVNGNTYSAGQVVGNGTVVAYSGNTSFTAASLTPATTYYFFIFAANGDCSGEPFFNTTSLQASATTTNTSTGVPAGYYNAAANLTCEPLKTALYNIISSNTTQLTYTPGVWDAFLTTDLHRNDANTANIIWDIYTDNPTGPETYTFNPTSTRCGSYNGEGDCYNREHSFPQIWFGAGTFPMFSDLHHVFPTDGWNNGKHDNNPYSEVGTATYTTSNGSKLGNNTFPGFTGTVFEPINEYKGDIARAMLYMVTRYQNNMVAWQNNGNADDILNGTTYPSLDDWYIKLLFKWHTLDPVSTKEINRNNAIYTLQKNRNPFVDHPEYVALIFQCTGLLPVTIIDFKAVKNNKSVQLNWIVSNETNFKNYEVERSSDGFNFVKVGTVAGQNLSNYQLIDEKLPNAKQVFYRLKMIDSDGKFTLSKIVSVRLENSLATALVYPNPSTGKFTILLEKALTSKGNLVVTDITGRKIAEQNVNAAQNTISMDMDDLPAGRYFLTIKNNNELIKESFVIIK